MHWEIDAEGNLTVTGSGDYEIVDNIDTGFAYTAAISGPEWLKYALYIRTADIDVTNITSTQYMLYCCMLMGTVELSDLDTSKVTNMNRMFGGCHNLNELDLSNFDTSQVTDMSSMFGGCYNMKSLDVSSFNTSSVTDMSGMFTNCYKISELDLSNFDTSQVTNMSHMFDSFLGSKTLDLSGFDTSNVTDMSSMFYLCGLSELDVSNFNTSKVTNMKDMFRICPNLVSLNVSNLDISKADMQGNVFEYCSSLRSLDLSGFDTSTMTSMYSMFRGCSSLVSLKLSGKFNTSNVTGMHSMFEGCSSLKTLDLSSIDTSNVMDMGSMFEGCSSLKTLDLSSIDTSNVVNMTYMFWRCGSLTSLNLSGKFNTSNAMSMDSMFRDCSSLTSLDVSNFNTRRVGNMSIMFGACSSLTSLDVSSFETSKVADMYSMFWNCSSLTSLDVSNFDTSNVTRMDGMFADCSSLTSLDVNKFNTSQVTDMGSMFYNCSSLTSLDVSKFNTSQVTDMGFMFYNCSSLTSLDVSKFNTSQVTYMIRMFEGCSSLKALDISSFDFNNMMNQEWDGWVEYMKNILNGCMALKTLVFCANAPFSVNLPSADGGCWLNENDETCTETAAQLDRIMTYRRDSSNPPVPPENPPVTPDVPSVPDDDVNTGIYSDSTNTALAPLSVRTHFVNGGNVKQADGSKLNFKTKYYYTKLLASNIVTTDKKGKTKTKTGKLIVGITSSADKPVLSKGKIVDAAASKTASASIRKDKITVTAKTQPGTVYLWVMDTGDVAAFAYAKIVVKAAPSKLLTFAVSSSSADFSPDIKNAYKKDTVELGQTVDLYLYPSYSLNRTLTETKDASYSVEVPSQYSSYFTAVQDAGNPYLFHVTANALKNNKKTTGRVIITCKENGKKASFTVTAVNSVQSIDILPQSGISVATAGAAVCEFSLGRSDTDKTTGNFSISVSKSSSDFETTDIVKLYAMGTADGFDRAQMEKGKVKITAKPDANQKKLTAKLERDKKTVTVTAAKKIPSGTSVYCLIMYNKKEGTGYKIVKLTAV